MPERNCSTCTVQQKWQWGCTTDAKGTKLVLDGVELLRCPRRPLLDDPGTYRELLWLYKQFQRGFLPGPGGLDDQPAKLIACFRVMDDTLAYTDGVLRAREEARRRRAEGAGGRR